MRSEGETGFLYSPMDTKELARKLLCCIGISTDLKAIGMEARRWVEENRNWRDYALRMQSIFNLVIGIKERDT